MSTVFVPNRAAYDDITRMPGMIDAMEEYAGEIASNAKAVAPTDEFDYYNGIQVDKGIDGTCGLARVNAMDWKSGLIEFGTGAPGPTPTFAPLRRGAESAGHRLVGDHGLTT